jgi:FkbM family methyltransferase
MIAISSVITAFYRVLLMREPDLPGLLAHTEGVATGAWTLEKLMAAFFKSEEFQTIAPRVLEAHVSSDNLRFTNDQTQFGEFGILMRHWVNDGAAHRIVVDVGARGKERSNSYDLLRVFGWQGLLIEANPALIQPIHEDFADLDYELLNFAISDYEAAATFHIGVNDDVSSLNPQASLAWGSIQGEVVVNVRRLHPLLDARAIPRDFDLLSLDIEGEDIRVLNDLIGSSTYRPRWVIIEASANYATRSLDDLDLVDVVKSSYRIVGQTPANLILKLVG